MAFINLPHVSLDQTLPLIPRQFMHITNIELFKDVFSFIGEARQAELVLGTENP